MTTVADPEIVNQLKADLQAGRVETALKATQVLLRQSPEAVDYWIVYSEILAHPSVAGDSVSAIDRAAQLAPENGPVQAHCANAHMLAGNFSRAQLIATKALKGCELDAMALDKLGNVFHGCNELERAYYCFSRAVELAPHDTHFLFNLATLQRAMGKMRDAERAFDHIVAMNPGDTAAYLARSSLRTYSEDDNHVEQIIARLAREKSTTAQIRLCYAAAKELEDTGAYARSFEYLQRGSTLRRSRMDYSLDQDIAVMDQICACFDSDWKSSSGEGYETSEPIFILGLPRTGTTLAERIVSSHSEVFAAGEMQNFSVELIKQVRALAQNTVSDRLDFVSASSRLNLRDLGESYLNSTRPHTGRQPRFIDKLPLNFLYLGLIKQALPNAKIVHLTRAPMDACYAIYKTLFQQVYPFSYDLEELGRYYLGYRRLMDHWQRLFGQDVYNLNYETLVQDQEAESRALLDFCELDWQPQCLDFQDNRAPSSTASASQVRQGIYDSSVGRWRCYEEQLAPLMHTLSAAGISLEHW